MNAKRKSLDLQDDVSRVGYMGAWVHRVCNTVIHCPVQEMRYRAVCTLVVMPGG